MARRLAAAVVALVLAFATGMAGSVSYLCWMDGQVRSACCCKSEAKGEVSDCAKVERGDACCKVRISKVQAQPAISEDRLQSDCSPALLAWIPPASRDVLSTGRKVAPFLGARAPPGGVGPPIFLLHCRYLI